MPVDIFRRPIFSLSISAGTCTFAAQGLAFVSLPFYFATVLGRSATDTGILLTAWPLALAFMAPIAGRLADRHHAGLLGAIGLTLMTAGLVLTALLPPDPSAANIMWRLVLCGAGFGIFAAPNNRLGAALVALVFGLFDFSGSGAADAARAAIWLGAGFAAAALVIGSLRLRH
jgi:DHA2 family multidrug resistance protein-like MFS transporter